MSSAQIEQKSYEMPPRFFGVTSGLAVIRPKLEKLGFPRSLFSMNA